MTSEELLNALGMETVQEDKDQRGLIEGVRMKSERSTNEDFKEKVYDEKGSSDMIEAALEDELEDEFEKDFLAHGDDPLGLVSDSDLTEPAARKIKLLRRESKKLFPKV